MKRIFPLLSMTVAVVVGAAVILSSESKAEPRVDVGVSVGIPLPRGYVDVTVGREHFYVHRGVFYRRARHGFVVVRAPRGAVLRVLPPRCERIHVNNVVYFRFGDVYYRAVPHGYIVVDPPATMVVPPAPPADEYQSVWVGRAEYLFKDGQFFRKTPEGLVWTEAPMGAVTRTLPSDATRVWYRDVEYFDCDDVYFRRVAEGYRVVPVPWRK